MSKHTPGPWHWDSDAIKGDPLGRVRYRVLAKGRTITQCYYSSGDDQSLVDTRLIAAAPELLEAAKMVLAWHDAETDPSGTTFWERVEMCRESEDALRTAVKKATGVEQ